MIAKMMYFSLDTLNYRVICMIDSLWNHMYNPNSILALHIQILLIVNDLGDYVCRHGISWRMITSHGE